MDINIGGNDPFSPVNLAAGLVVNFASKILESKGQTLEDTRFGGFLKKIGIIAQNTNDTLRDAINETEKLFFQKHTEYHLSGFQLFFEHETTIAQIKNRLFNHEPFEQSQLEQTLKNCFGSTIGKLNEKHIETNALMPNFFACFYEVLQKHKDNEVLLLLYGNLKQTEEILATLQAEGQHTRDAVITAIDKAIDSFVTIITTLQTQGQRVVVAELTAVFDETVDRLKLETQAPSTQLVGSARLIRGSNDFSRAELPVKLFGRDSLLKRIHKHLVSGKQVLLQGFAGIGKTALAANATLRWIEAGKGPALWLRAGNADETTLYVGLALTDDNRRQMIITQGDARKDLLHQLLHDSGATLLVLDDAWNEDSLTVLLGDMPHGIPVLVTARKPFPLDEVEDNLDLSPNDALRLLNYHRDDTSDKDKARQLCKKLGNLAFAVEIAGKVIRQRTGKHKGAFTPQHLLDEMEKTPQRSKVLGNVDRLLDVSLNALDETARTAFLSFGAFFTPTATPELLSIYLPASVGTQHAVSALLNTLQDHGLAEKIPETADSVAYFRIHHLAYTYARAQNEDSAHDWAVAACLTYTGRYNTPSRANFAALRSELNNFMGAAKWAFETERWAQVEQFAWNLYANSRMLDYLGFYRQAVTLLEQAAYASEKRGNERNRSAHLGNLGLVYFHLGQYEQAIEYHRQALAIAHDIGDRHGEGKHLGNLGSVYYALGNYAQAIEYHRQALAIAHDIGDRHGENGNLGNLGLAYFSLGQYPQAINHHRQALAIARDIGDRRSEGIHLGNLGSVYYALGDYPAANEYYEQVLAIARDIGDRLNEGHALNNLGAVCEEQRNYHRALGYYRQSRTIYDDLELVDRVEAVDRLIAEAEAARD